MQTRTTVTSFELKSYKTDTQSTIKLWLYFGCAVDCLGDNVIPTQSILYQVAKKLRKPETPATRVQAMGQAIIERTAWFARDRNAYLATGDNTFAEFYGDTGKQLRELFENDVKDEGGGAWHQRREDLAMRCAAIAQCAERELRKAVEHWDAHGFLSWNLADMPLWNVREKINQFCHAASVGKLHRLHIVHTAAVANRDAETVFITGRNAAAKKKIEAQLELLHHAMPQIVSHHAGQWSFRGAEGSELCALWLKNFYEDSAFRSMMRVAIT